MSRRIAIPCPQCGYDLRGTLGSPRCPECGGDVRTVYGEVQIGELLWREYIGLSFMALSLSAIVATIVTLLGSIIYVGQHAEPIVVLSVPLVLCVVFNAGFLSSVALMLQSSPGRRRRELFDVLTGAAWVLWIITLPTLCVVPVGVVVALRASLLFFIGRGILRCARRLEVEDQRRARIASVVGIAATGVIVILLLTESTLVPRSLRAPEGLGYLACAFVDTAAQAIFVFAARPMRRYVGL